MRDILRHRLVASSPYTDTILRFSQTFLTGKSIADVRPSSPAHRSQLQRRD